MTEETLPAVTAAREALAHWKDPYDLTRAEIVGQRLANALSDLLAVVDRLTSDLGSAQRALAATDDFRIADWKKLEMERDMAEAEVDRLTSEMHQRELHHFETEKLVDRLTAPVAREDVDAALDALDEQYGTITMTEIRHLVGPLRTFVAAAIVAASGRRHLPTETEWGTALRSTNGEVWDHFSWGANEAGARKELVEWNPDDTAPDVLVLVRRTPEVPAGPWEVCDEQ